MKKLQTKKEIIVLVFCILVTLNITKAYGQQSDVKNAHTGLYSNVDVNYLQKIENVIHLAQLRDEIVKVKIETGKLSDEQQDNLNRLNFDIAAVNKASRNALDVLNKIEINTDGGILSFIRQRGDLQRELEKLRNGTTSGAVALYTVLGTEREKDAKGKPLGNESKFGWVIMVTETFYKVYPIDVTNLAETIPQFRSVLSSDKYNPQPLAEKMYSAIFRQASPKLKRTLEDDLRDYLKSYADKTVMWSLNGVLRDFPVTALYDFPVTALHDGKNYLVEKYNNFIFTNASIPTLSEQNNRNGKILGLGVSKQVEGFSSLPGVERELNEIVRTPNSPNGILDGVIKLNQEFTKKALLDDLGKDEYSVIHIASHFSYNRVKPQDSFLLLGEGRLTIDEIMNKSGLFLSADLIVLSACDTMTDTRFPYLLQEYGAKSVIASLWEVSDAGTPELMIRFYKLRAKNPTLAKGEAFRQAQLSLLGVETKSAGNINSNRSGVVDFGGKKIDLPLYQKDEKKPFAHPHYWLSFVLIGNWR